MNSHDEDDDAAHTALIAVVTVIVALAALFLVTTLCVWCMVRHRRAVNARSYEAGVYEREVRERNRETNVASAPVDPWERAVHCGLQRGESAVSLDSNPRATVSQLEPNVIPPLAPSDGREPNATKSEHSETRSSVAEQQFDITVADMAHRLMPRSCAISVVPTSATPTLENRPISRREDLDGSVYSKDEYVAYYGSENEWHSRPSRSNASAGSPRLATVGEELLIEEPLGTGGEIEALAAADSEVDVSVEDLAASLALRQGTDTLYL